jgi:hypothetical protein
MLNFRKKLKVLNSSTTTEEESESANQLRIHLPIPFLIGLSGTLVIAIVSYVLLPFNVWNRYFTPDSEFYLSLLVFGNELVEKVVNPAYYWTKSAQIIPEHLLASAFGWEYGIQISQFMKLLTLAIASFIIFYSTRRNVLVALTFVSFLTLNGTILTMLGNTYVTATALSILTLFYMVLKFFVDSSFSNGVKHIISIALISGILTFSLFVYPILAANLLIILGTFVVMLLLTQVKSFKYFLRFFSTAIFTIGMTFSLLLFITGLFFPNQNWLSTVIFYTKNLNPSDYSSDSKYSVLFGDFSLLVIGVGFVISLLVIVNRKNFTQNTYFVAFSQISLFLSALLQVQFLNSAVLEASFISAFYWIPSLLIISLYFIETTPIFSISLFKKTLYFVIGLGFFSSLRFWTDDIFRNSIHSRTINVFLVFLILLLILYQPKIPFGRTIFFQIAFTVFVYVSFAYFQNSRELSNSAIGRIPYFSSTENRGVGEARTHVFVEKAVLAQLKGAEKGVVWTPPGSNLVTFAAMHFWGPNSMSLGNELSPVEANYFKVLRPEKLFVYVSKSDDSVIFLKSLEKNGIQYSMRKSIQSVDAGDNVFYVISYSLKFLKP